MTIKESILENLKDAMRARDKAKLEALRLISASIKQIEVDERILVDDARMMVILDKLAKQRLESIRLFQEGGRSDLVEKEQFELNLIKQYLPEAMSMLEVEKIIDKAIATLGASQISDMGKVMAVLKPQLLGRADMSHASSYLKNRLN
jgi:hypothetical protein